MVQSDQRRISGLYASIYPNQHDLVLVRQQRDLFSGGPSPTLGIPDVTTRVGSVIHAFETLAHQRQQRDAEMIYESSKSMSGSSNRKEAMHKIILPPPPPKVSTGTLTDPIARHIVRHRPKGRAPDVPSSSTNTASATTQTTKLSADEIESSAMDSLNLEDDYRLKSTATVTKFPQSYVKNYKVLPPFVPPRNHQQQQQQPSRIPTKAMNKSSNGNQLSTARNRMSDSLLSMPSSSSRTNVFLKSNTHKPTAATVTEEEIENDFLRGSTVSQSFIKNVVRKSPQTRKLSTYEQNFLVNDAIDSAKARRSARESKARSANFQQPLMDEVSKRYKEYTGNKNNETSLRQSSRQYNFQPRSIDRADL